MNQTNEQVKAIIKLFALITITVYTLANFNAYFIDVFIQKVKEQKDEKKLQINIDDAARVCEKYNIK